MIVDIKPMGGGPEKRTKFRVFARPISVGNHPCETRWKPFETGFVISGKF